MTVTGNQFILFCQFLTHEDFYPLMRGKLNHFLKKQFHRLKKFWKRGARTTNKWFEIHIPMYYSSLCFVLCAVILLS